MRHRLSPSAVILILLSSLFTIYTWVTGGIEGEVAVLRAVRESPQPLPAIYRALNFLGSPLPSVVIWAALTLLAWWMWGRRAALYQMGTLIYYPLSQILKRLVGRYRPGGLPLSYPSGHVMFYCTVLGGFLLLWGRGRGSGRTALTLLFILLYLFSSLSRMYVGAHWPTDTVGALLLSLALILTLRDLILVSGPGNETDVEE